MSPEHGTRSRAHTTTRDLLSSKVYLLLLLKSVSFRVLHVYNIFMLKYSTYSHMYYQHIRCNTCAFYLTLCSQQLSANYFYNL